MPDSSPRLPARCGDLLRVALSAFAILVAFFAFVTPVPLERIQQLAGRVVSFSSLTSFFFKQKAQELSHPVGSYLVPFNKS